MVKKTNPLKLDLYDTKGKRASKLSKAETIYLKSWFTNLIIVVFVVIDYFCLQTIWNYVQTEDRLYVILIALACAIALDVPMAIAAMSLTRYRQKLLGKGRAFAICGTAFSVFILAFTFSLLFRVVTKDIAFDVSASSTTVNTIGSSAAVTDYADTTSQIVLFSGLFSGIIPLLTSLCSFALVLFSYNPIQARQFKLEKAKIQLEANIVELNEAIAQCSSAAYRCRGLLAREHDLFANEIEKLNSDYNLLMQIARQTFMIKLGEAEDITTLAKSGQAAYEALHLDDAPRIEMSDFINSICEIDPSGDMIEEVSL